MTYHYWYQGSHGIEKPGKSREYWNAVFPVGKVGKKSGIQYIVISIVELWHYSIHILKFKSLDVMDFEIWEAKNGKKNTLT